MLQSFRVDSTKQHHLALALLPALQLLQLIDDTFNCWSFAFYWLDIVALALQAADGKPGPAAVAAAQQLMQEKHSIFVARCVCVHEVPGSIGCTHVAVHVPVHAYTECVIV